jgi:hypothetical protein
MVNKEKEEHISCSNLQTIAEYYRMMKEDRIALAYIVLFYSLVLVGFVYIMYSLFMNLIIRL